LVARESLCAALSRSGLDIVWTVVGERLTLGGRDEERIGGRQFSGLYWLTPRGVLKGGLTMQSCYDRETGRKAITRL